MRSRRICPRLRVNLALAYLQLNKPAEAAAQLEQAAAGGNADPRVQFQLGGAYVDMKQLDKAMTAFETGLARQPDLQGPRRVGGGRHAWQRCISRKATPTRPPRSSRSRWPPGPMRRRQCSASAKIYASKGDTAKALGLFDRWSPHTPAHPKRSRPRCSSRNFASERGCFRGGDVVLKRLIVSVAAGAVLVTAAAIGQAPTEKGGGNETGPYDLVTGWPENYCGAGHVFGSTGGIWAESPDRVFIFNRGCLPELKERPRRGRQLHPQPERIGLRSVAARPARHPRWDHVLQHRQPRRAS